MGVCEQSTRMLVIYCTQILSRRRVAFAEFDNKLFSRKSVYKSKQFKNLTILHFVRFYLTKRKYFPVNNEVK